MSKEIVKVNPLEFGLEETKANEMVSGLTQSLSEREILSVQYDEIIKKEINEILVKEAKELRLRIRDNRTKGIETWHKVNKEFYLRGGQFVDAIKRKEVAENERMEENLLSIEKHFENLEKQRLDELNCQRIELIKPFVEDLQGLDFRTMNEDVFNAFLVAKEKAYNDKLEAERLAEEQRIAKEKSEAEERERVRIENEKLQAQLKKEREENEAKQKAIEEKARLEREEMERKAKEEKAKQDAILLEQKRKADEEAKKQADIIAKQQAELQVKKEAEIKAQKEREEVERKAKLEADKIAKAPIKKQLKVWVDSFSISSTEIDNETTKLIKEKFESFKTWANSQVDNL